MERGHVLLHIEPKEKNIASCSIRANTGVSLNATGTKSGGCWCSRLGLTASHFGIQPC